MTKEELKKEADNYADKHAFRVPYDGSNKFYDDVDFKASREGYLAGAEPREKRIKELEQKNAILKGRTEAFEKQILGLLYKYESVYKHFPDLKDAMNEAERVLKENAELKEKLEHRNCLDCSNHHSNIKLIKAKEIIRDQKELLDRVLSGAETLSDFAQNTLRKAEQFLKEIEK